MRKLQNSIGAVIAMPMTPKLNFELGYELIPTLTDTVAKILGCNGIIGINALDSISNRVNYIEGYKSRIETMNYGLRSVVDLDVLDDMLEGLDILIKKGAIYVKKRKICICQCGRVEILEEVAKKITNPKIFRKNEDGMFCNMCKTQCKIIEEDVLLLKVPSEIPDDVVKVFPDLARKDVIACLDKVKNQEIMVSRHRKTGVSVKMNDIEYNVDIDFASACFHRVAKTNKVLVTSNHQAHYVALNIIVNYIFNKESLAFIEVPYLVSDERSREIQKRTSDEIKLAILLSLKWRNREIKISQDIINLINKKNNYQIKKILDYFCNGGTEGNPKDDEEQFLYIQRVLKYGFRLGKNSMHPKIWI